MRYVSFTIKKFKGIGTVTIDLTNNRVITLVGLNESGKTTIMDAINLFHRLIKGEILTENEMNSFRPKGPGFTGYIEITGKLILDSDDNYRINSYWKYSMRKRIKLTLPSTFSYTFKFHFTKDKYFASDSKHSCEYVVSRPDARLELASTDYNLWQILIEYIKKEVVPEILFYDDFIFEIPNKIQFIKNNETDNALYSKDVEINLNDIWKLVIDDILKSTDSQFDSFQERVVDKWDDDLDIAKQHLSKMEGKLNEVITKRWKDLFVDKGKKIIFERIRLNCIPDGKFINISFDVITSNQDSFRIDERSKGCKWFFSFLLFTEFRKNRTKNILFLLDEPASNLHSSAQVKIIDALGELSKNSQVIYATHSHHMINIDWLDGAYIIINKEHSKSLDDIMTSFNGTRITAKKYYTYVGEGLGDDKVSYFQPILDALEYKPSAVEPIPNICILEGKYDWYTFKYFQDILLKDTYQYNFYPGAGATKLWDILRLYLAWGKDFIVIIDGDSAGVEAKKKYIEEFGVLIEKRIFTLKDILNLPCPTEMLIDETDKEKICNEIFKNTLVNKKNLNYAINQLYALNKEIQISEATKERFRAVFSFIKEYFKSNEEFYP